MTCLSNNVIIDVSEKYFMYKVTYLPDPTRFEVDIASFGTFIGAIYFANKFRVEGQVLEIKWYPKENKKPDRN